MENVITLGKLIGLLFCSLPPSLLYFFNLKNRRNELARPVMGTIFLVIIIGERAKRARHSQVCSIENRGYIYIIIYVTGSAKRGHMVQ